MLGLGSFSLILNAIIYFAAAGRPNYSNAKGVFVGTGVFLIIVAVIDITHAFVFRAYINKYKSTYNLIPSIGAYSQQPMVAAHRV
jgi:hypothetical protein